MNIRKILIVYKRSVFEKSFQGSSFLKKKNSPVIAAHLKKVFQAHKAHYQSFQIVCDSLENLKIPFEVAERKDQIDFKSFDVILTVGGDGTFMEVSHQIKDQIVLGVNSAPEYSVGRYCCSDAKHLKNVLKNLISEVSKIKLLYRLQLKLNGKVVADCMLNDFLVAHQNPAMMSRYLLKTGIRKEEQKSSGIWIATPSGSSGAVKSAGGKVISSDQKTMVYCPRELHQGLSRKYVLKGGVLSAGQSIQVTSMMRDGMIYGDGGLTVIPFPYGAVVDIAFSKFSLKTIQVKS